MWKVVVVVLALLRPEDRLTGCCCRGATSADGTEGGAREKIYVGGFFPITGSYSAFGPGLVPAAALAVQHVNARVDVLPGFELEFINVDTKVNGRKLDEQTNRAAVGRTGVYAEE